jgi:ParB-like chromosome segregation protein Spo0J
MTFTAHIKSPAVREALIKSAVSASTKEEDFWYFRNARTALKVVRIPQDLLLYRMENFRTFTDQRAFILRENKPDDFFISGQENESVQQVQHALLAQLARKGIDRSVTPIINVLRSEGQREPLLITSKGVVVNGNRRLAAMREISTDEFSHVDCLVLPEDASPDDILEVEAGLQGRPETKLDYDWIGDCQLIKRLMQVGRTEKWISEHLNRKPGEIRNALAALTETNLYLKEWANAEGEYTRVREAEQFWKDLPGLLQGKEQQVAEASRVVAWTLYDNRDKLNERLYAFNLTIGKEAEDVLDRLADELGVSLEATPLEEEGGFDVDIDGGTGNTSYQPITGLLRDPEKRDEAVETLVEICREVIEEARGKKTGNAALKAIGAANSRLMEVDLGKADISTYATIGRQLEQIQKGVGELRTTLDALVASRSNQTNANGGK